LSDKFKENKKVLDLTRLDVNNSKLVDAIAKDIQLEYVNYISEIGRDNEKKVDWWVLNFVSRNTFISNLFRNICLLILIKKNLANGNIYDEIVVDSLNLSYIIKKFCQENEYYCKVIYKGKRYLYLYSLRIYRYIKIILSFSFRWLSGWITHGHKEKLKLDENIILIDTFIHKNDFKNGLYIDHYYPELLDYLNPDEKKYIYYVPEYFGVKNYIKLFTNIRNSGQNFLLKEDYLKVKDYFSALLFPLRIKFIKVKQELFKDFDIFPLIKEEIFNDSVSNSSMCGLLNYKFAKRLKDKCVKIKTIINWFENQSIDHGFNMGFRKFYPETFLKGYLGFTPQNNYLSLYPTRQEINAEVVPNEIDVIGKGYINEIKKFCPNLSVKVAPAFRYMGVWNKRKYFPDKNSFTALIALPMLIDISDEIINLISEVMQSNKINGNYVFKIKIHPTQNEEFLRKRWKEKIHKDLEFISGNFQDCLEKVNVLITSASSVCLETIARGIPVIVLANRLGLTQLPIPEDVKKDIWKLCYTPDDVIDAIKYYANRENKADDYFQKTGDKIRKKFFEPVTELGVRRLLNL
jgi:hypothetical protein